MAGENPYVVALVKEQDAINKRRGLAFLICENDKKIDAKSVFDRLKLKADQQLRTGFDFWLTGKTNTKRFHGWNEAENRDCFVFKWKEGSQGHRLYGFLCHPLLEYPNFQLCVLVLHATKNRRETEPRLLKKVNDLRANDLVRRAITVATKDLKPGETK
jgi:hypothetical protein